jgi:hypothetical protein
MEIVLDSSLHIPQIKAIHEKLRKQQTKNSFFFTIATAILFEHSLHYTNVRRRWDLFTSSTIRFCCVFATAKENSQRVFMYKA